MVCERGRTGKTKKKKKNNLFHVCLGAGHRGWLEGGREERVILGVVQY